MSGLPVVADDGQAVGRRYVPTRGKFGVGYSGGTRKAILISLTSPSSLALPHMALPCFERADPVNASYGPGITFTQIAPVDLDIAIVRQLPSSQLPFN